MRDLESQRKEEDTTHRCSQLGTHDDDDAEDLAGTELGWYHNSSYVAVEAASSAGTTNDQENKTDGHTNEDDDITIRFTSRKFGSEAMEEAADSEAEDGRMTS